MIPTEISPLLQSKQFQTNGLQAGTEVSLVSRRINIPLLLIWGAQDRFLGRELVWPSLAFCDHGCLEVIDEAGHWVQHEEPEKVNELLASFFVPSFRLTE